MDGERIIRAWNWKTNMEETFVDVIFTEIRPNDYENS